MNAEVKRFVMLDEEGKGSIVEEHRIPATPEEVLRLVGSKCREFTAALQGVIPNGVLLVDASEKGKYFALRSWGFSMRLPFLRLYGAFVRARRSDGSYCLIPQPVRVDEDGTPIPGGLDLSLDWTPPKRFGLLLTRAGSDTYAALVDRTTQITYRLPFGNCYADGRMCMGSGLALNPELSVYENAQLVIRHFLSVKWTQDLSRSGDDAFCAELFGFDVDEPHAQLPPLLDENALCEKMGGPEGLKIGLNSDCLTGLQSINWGREVQ